MLSFISVKLNWNVQPNPRPLYLSSSHKAYFFFFARKDVKLLEILSYRRIIFFLGNSYLKAHDICVFLVFFLSGIRCPPLLPTCTTG